MCMPKVPSMVGPHPSSPTPGAPEERNGGRRELRRANALNADQPGNVLPQLQTERFDNTCNMRKLRDFDAELKSLEDNPKSSGLSNSKIDAAEKSHEFTLTQRPLVIG